MLAVSCVLLVMKRMIIYSFLALSHLQCGSIFWLRTTFIGLVWIWSMRCSGLGSIGVVLICSTFLWNFPVQQLSIICGGRGIGIFFSLSVLILIKSLKKLLLISGVMWVPGGTLEDLMLIDWSVLSGTFQLRFLQLPKAFLSRFNRRVWLFAWVVTHWGMPLWFCNLLFLLIKF